MPQHSFFFDEGISQQCVSLDPRRVEELTDVPLPKNWEGITLISEYTKLPMKFSPVTADVCEPLKKLTSVRIDWVWNRMYQDLYDKAKMIIMKDACMKCYNASRPWYLETDALGVSLGARLLHVRDGMNSGHDEVQDNAILCPTAFASKIPSSAKWYYKNIEWEALGILHCLKKLCHYCFAKVVYVFNSGTDSLIQNMFWLQKTSFQGLWALHQVRPDEELRELESLSFAIKTCSV